MWDIAPNVMVRELGRISLMTCHCKPLVDVTTQFTQDLPALIFIYCISTKQHSHCNHLVHILQATYATWKYMYIWFKKQKSLFLSNTIYNIDFIVLCIINSVFSLFDTSLRCHTLQLRDKKVDHSLSVSNTKIHFFTVLFCLLLGWYLLGLKTTYLCALG